MRRFKGKTSYKMMTAVVAVAMVGALLSGCAASTKQSSGAQRGRNAPRTMPVVTQEVKMTDVGGAQIFMGSVAPEFTTNVSSKVSGRVTGLLVKVGDQVKTGQPLAQIDTTALEQQIAQSANSLAIQRAQYQKALNDQANSLTSAENALKMQQLQFAKTQNDQQNSIASAKLSVELSQAQLAKAKKDQENSVNSARQALASAQAQLAKTQSDAANSIANAQNALNTAQDNLDASQVNSDDSVESLQQTYDQAKTTYADALSVYQASNTTQNKKASDDAYTKMKAAELDLNQALEGNDPKVISAQNAVNKAQADLNAALNSQSVQIQQESLNKSLQDLANAQEATTSTQQLQLNQQQNSLSNSIASQEISLGTAKQQLAQAEQALENAQNSESIKVNEAQLKQSEDNYNALQQQLEDATVKAPVDGVITAVNTPVGQNPGGQTGIVTISSMDPLIVSIGVSESAIGKFKEGMEMSVHIPVLDKNYDGIVKQIRPTMDATTKSYGVDITIKDPKHEVLPGMFAETSLKSEGRKAIMVPADAVLNQPSGNAAFIVVDGKAKKVSVKIGAVSSTTFEITNGLKEGEKLVVKGQELLSNNVNVEEVDPDAIDNPQAAKGQGQQGKSQGGQQGGAKGQQGKSQGGQQGGAQGQQGKSQGGQQGKSQGGQQGGQGNAPANASQGNAAQGNAAQSNAAKAGAGQ